MFNGLTVYRQQWFAGAATARADILAGIVVALALIPEAIGFSIIAGVDPRVGLYASIAIAIVISFTGGRPGMISAATAAVAVLVIPLVKEHGVEYLFAATILMGLIQIIAGLLRLDLVMQFVSRSVITGFVNALAILIFMAQLPQLTNVTWQAYAMVAGGLAIIYLLPRLTKAVPSPLVAILILSAISVGFGLPVNTVGDMGKLPEGLPSIGSKLLDLADQEARSRKCHHMLLDTQAFQAKPFYERHGFEVFGQIEGPAPYYPRFFMQKPLRRCLWAPSTFETPE